MTFALRKYKYYDMTLDKLEPITYSRCQSLLSIRHMKTSLCATKLTFEALSCSEYFLVSLPGYEHKIYEHLPRNIFLIDNKSLPTFVHARVLILKHCELVNLAELLEHGPEVVLLEVSRYLAYEQFDGVLSRARRRARPLRRRQRGRALGVGAVAVHRRRRRRADARLPTLRNADHVHVLHVVPQQHWVHTSHIRSHNHVYHS